MRRSKRLETVRAYRFKLLELPALAVAHWGFGLAGLSLQVVVMMASLPSGSNALISAQRSRLQEARRPPQSCGR